MVYIPSIPTIDKLLEAVDITILHERIKIDKIPYTIPNCVKDIMFDNLDNVKEIVLTINDLFIRSFNVDGVKNFTLPFWKEIVYFRNSNINCKFTPIYVTDNGCSMTMSYIPCSISFYNFPLISYINYLIPLYGESDKIKEYLYVGKGIAILNEKTLIFLKTWKLIV